MKQPVIQSAPARHIIDLHLHSTHSDGLLLPSALVQCCLANQLQMIALTDHDTLEGIPEIQKAAEKETIAILPGAEISAQWQNSTLHILAYFPVADANMKDLNDFLHCSQQARWLRAQKIADYLEQRGFDNALTLAQQQSQQPYNLGRPHFARAMVAAGWVKNIAQAFQHHLTDRQINIQANVWPALATVIDIIKQSQGIAILAHPLRYGFQPTQLAMLFADFRRFGADGLEIINGNQNTKETRRLTNLVLANNWFASCGSDFHYLSHYSWPGNYSIWPNLAVNPIMRHPLFSAWFDQYPYLINSQF